ncbi:putative inositol monophosphatase 3 [Toxorhynchites rutilus septentrionalis]|uniref:putative inositol monophosphatase 3 n=1 Tax=Toxorhynchites rutilus septentrionalis TaxID=329112 RepID=UPI00247B2D00|nr:putative inositol monophosphatase 3 [Toxorhynchites rutilus septentrionalis]
MNLGGSIRINKFGVFIITLILLVFGYYLSTGRSRSTNYAVNKDPNKVNLRKLLIGSIQAAQHGGIKVVEVSESPDINIHSKGKTKEGVNDPVTDADFRSHCVMMNGLHRIFPKLNIISEEDATKRNCPDEKLFDLDPTVMQENSNVPDETIDIEDVTVWIDPLDATQEYTEKLFQYVTTMVCVAIKGVPTIGVIHNPFTKITTWAWVHKAVSESLNNLKKDDDVKNPIVIVSRSHTGDVKNIAKDVFGVSSRIIPAGGAGYKVLQVIHNNATGYIHSTAIKKWDICAGNAILNSVGGKMTDLRNQEILYGDKEYFVNKHGLLATATETTHELYITKIIEQKLLI